MHTGVLHNTKSSILLGSVMAIVFLFSNPSIYKIGNSLPNFHFSTTASREKPVIIQLGPESIQISIPVAAASVYAEPIAAPAISAGQPITSNTQVSSVEIAAPQPVEVAPQSFTAPAVPIPISSPAPISAEVAPSITEISVPVIESVVAPAQVAAPALSESVTVSEPAIENIVTETPAPVAEAVSTPVPAESISQEAATPTEIAVAETPVIPDQSPAVLGATAAAEENQCHASYSGCLRIDASDYDCEGGSGNGPYYTGKVQVIGPDVFDLDRNNDGWGCEASN